MKSGPAAMVYAVKAIRDSNLKLGGRVGLMFVPDEEAGGAEGSAPVARAGVIGEDEPLAAAHGSNVEAATGKPPRFELCPGLLEIRFYAERGVPALAYGPGRL